LVLGLVERARNCYPRPQPWHIPTDERVALVAVGLGQVKVENLVDGVDLDFKVLVRIVIGVNEDLEVVVFENDVVVVGLRGPDLAPSISTKSDVQAAFCQSLSWRLPSKVSTWEVCCTT
jgi:hypothetical protein